MDRFWIKEQPYSLAFMLDHDPSVKKFVGGTIYQAYLSALSYHRWHSPISGRIVKTKLIDGSYYAQVPSLGFDPVSPNGSQGYLTAVAARGLILIEADNPDIGLMALLFVGMGDVSSNEITVYEGQHVTKGDDLGTFHFGGSTFCMIFRPGVKLEFDLRGQAPGLESTNIPVRSKLATVISEGSVSKKLDKKASR
jgi:phosphatidylserine decarboxylase